MLKNRAEKQGRQKSVDGTKGYRGIKKFSEVVQQKKMIIAKVKNQKFRKSIAETTGNMQNF